MKKNKAKEYTSPLIEGIFDEISKEELDDTGKDMKLACRIADAMNSKGWNKKQFAKQMNQDPSVITRWLSGTHNFQVRTLYAIERALGINLINTSSNPIRFILYETKNAPFEPTDHLKVRFQPEEAHEFADEY